MDHAADYAFVFAEVGKDDTRQVDQHEAIDDPLQKAVELFDGRVPGSQEGKILEGQAKTRQRHQQKRKVEDDVDAFHLDEWLQVYFCLPVGWL